MIRFTLSQLAAITRGERWDSDIAIDGMTSDIRKVAASCLSTALRGERFDTYDFAEQAKAAGTGALLVNRPLTRDFPQMIVKDTRQASSELAIWVRQQVPTRVVVLTDSSGKASVKGTTAVILSQCGNTLYTAGDLDSGVGVSMTLLRLTKEHQYAVIELGANHQGEIAWAVSLACSEVALVNNLAAAHPEGLGSLAGVAKAKSEIYTGLSENGIAILNVGNNDWLNWQAVIGDRKVQRFSPNAANSDFTMTNVQITSHGVEFTLQTPAGNADVLPLLPGRHNTANTPTATSLVMAVDADLATVKVGLAQLKAIPGRLFPIRLTESQLLLDDSYNTNVGSMTAAIQVLSEMPGFRVAMVDDVTEFGAESTTCRREVDEVAKAAGLDYVPSVGTLSAGINHASGVGEYFNDEVAVVACLHELLAEHKIMTVLAKGSCSAAMEEAVRALQEAGTC